MSFSNVAETAVLEQVFKGTALPWAANTDLWLALHTADPGEAGTAVTSEATYTSYARIPLVRATDFTVTGDTISNTNQEAFPQSTGGSNVITHATIVTTASGAGTAIARATLTSSITVTTGVQPLFAAGALSFTLN